jgi:hypothetical protein
VRIKNGPFQRTMKQSITNHHRRRNGSKSAINKKNSRNRRRKGRLRTYLRRHGPITIHNCTYAPLVPPWVRKEQRDWRTYEPVRTEDLSRYANSIMISSRIPGASSNSALRSGVREEHARSGGGGAREEGRGEVERSCNGYAAVTRKSRVRARKIKYVSNCYFNVQNLFLNSYHSRQHVPRAGGWVKLEFLSKIA